MTAREVAERLSPAQREVVMLAGENARPAYALHPDHRGVAAAGHIRRMPRDLFVRSWPLGSQHQHYRLSFDGLAVRAELIAMAGEADHA